MTDAQIALWLIAVGFFELSALVLFSTFIIGREALALNTILKTGLITLSLGLAVQLARSVHYLNYGTYPVDVHFPLWVLKDIGGALILYYFAGIKNETK